MNDLWKAIGEKANNLVGQNAEQIQKDWEASIKQQDAPENFKFPFVLKGDLTNKDGKKECHLKIEWSVIAKRSLGCDITDDGTPELFDADGEQPAATVTVTVNGAGKKKKEPKE